MGMTNGLVLTGNTARGGFEAATITDLMEVLSHVMVTAGKVDVADVRIEKREGCFRGEVDIEVEA
jgi:hypothetical protein